MTLLWIAAGLLGLAVAVMLAWPLLRRGEPEATRTDYDVQVFKDQLKEVDNDLARGLLNDREAQAARTEIERRLLAAAETEAAGSPPDRPAPGGRIAAIVVGLAVPLAAVGVYLVLGSPNYSDVPFASRDLAAERQAAETQATNNGPAAQQMAAAIKQLESRLEQKPDDLRGWVMLGRSYGVIGKYDEAETAFQRAYRLSGQRPEIGADYVEAMTLANGGQIPDRGRQLIDGIVKADPTNLKARYFQGLSAAQQGDIRRALQTWVDLRAMSPAGAPWLPIVEKQIKQAATEAKVDLKTVEPTAEAKALAAKIAEQAANQPAAPSSAAPAISDAQRKAVEQMSPEQRQAMIRSMVDRLANRLKDNPDDLQGWQRLARAYRVLGETDKAAAAEKQIERLQKTSGTAAPSSAAPPISDAQRKAVEQMSPEQRQAMIRSMVDRLANRLKDNPDDLQGWQRLARAYQVLGETDKAAEAQKQIERLQKRSQ